MSRMQLFLFMTDGMSLTRWRDLGMLDRELALYVRLASRVDGVFIVSYGGREDADIVSTLPGIEVICNRWGLPQRVYKHLLPILLKGSIRGPAIFKSNQVKGADLAFKLARRLKVGFVARCGYLLSEFQEYEFGQGSKEHNEAVGLEQLVFTGSDCCVVTTETMRARLLEYGVKEERLKVVPNYVDTDLFSPSGNGLVNAKRAVFIGRLEAQKNPIVLIQALEGLGVRLDVVGDGSLRHQLKAEASRRGVEVIFHGNIPHTELPHIIRESALFILPSHYEGHPKTLLEAMACGTAVIGARVPGIQEVISHQSTGWLCEPTAAGLREAINTLLENPELRTAMGDAAREFIISEYDLSRIVEMELAVYSKVWSDAENLGEGQSCPE